MKSKPITSKSKGSPLHVGEEGKTPATLGPKKVYNADGNLVNADDNATSGTPGETKVVQKKLPSYSEAYKNVDKQKYPTLQSFIDASEKFKKDKPEQFKKMSTETISTPGKDGERTTQYKPVLTEARDADKVDVFLPWERRFNQRTQRGAVRDEIRRGKKGMRQLDRALKAGVITQEQYDKDYAAAQKLAYGQGVIAKGQYTNTEAMDAIVSQGYQANPAVSTKTDMLRRPQGEQKAGQPVKADASVTMSQEEYENFGKSTPKTSASVQDASKKAGASVSAPKTSDASIIKIDGTSPSTDMFKGIESEDMGLMSDGPSQRTPQQPAPKKPSGPVGGKGIESDPLEGISNPNPDPIAQADKIFGSEGVTVSAPGPDALEEDLARDRTAFKKRGYKMNRSHRPDMMYKRNDSPSPAKMKDLSGDGKVTRKDVLIGRGVLNKDGSPAQKKSSAFKMKGFGSKYKK